MSLSTDLISQFVKITNDKTETKKETTVYGTTEEHNGVMYVRIDGSELLTPITTTTDVKPEERVMVLIKNHTATVTGNVTSPAARTGDVKEMGKQISEFEIAIADKVNTKEFEAEKARIDTLTTDNATIKELLTASEADIGKLQASSLTVKEQLDAQAASIANLQTSKLDAATADIKYATVENLQAVDTKVYNLEGTFATFTSTTTNKLNAVDASIKDLETNKLSASEADLKYANIDFSNIGQVAMEHLYSASGLIENVTISNGTITGYLVGVTIKGDLIEGNTVVADKLVIKGEDGLYYKLNTDGVTTEAEQTSQNSLNGSVIMAQSITASKISVDDLVAFDATIGGFNITDNAIYSGVKSSVDNTTQGVYLDSTGQVAFGDLNNFIKYFRDADGTYKLVISADNLIFASTGKSVEDEITDVQNSSEEFSTRAESLINQLSDNISMLVTDGNGTSLMTQTEDGWTFSTAAIQSAVNATSEALGELTSEMGSTKSAVNVLEQAVNDLGELAEYIRIGTYEGEPCIELGEGDSEFKLRITNTQIAFMEGSNIVAYITNQSLHIKKAVIEEELQQGEFAWVIRSNGNMGLVWKGASS